MSGVRFRDQAEGVRVRTSRLYGDNGREACRTSGVFDLEGDGSVFTPIVVSYLTHDNNENNILAAMSAIHVNEVPETCPRLSRGGAVI